MTTYAISATVETTVATARSTLTWNGARQVPTFYLNSAVQGITTPEHAESIARDVIDPLGTYHDRIHVNAVAVDAGQEAVDALLVKATELGNEHGRNAAHWATQGIAADGAARIIRGIDDGDPAVYDQFRTPSLSGEYADDMTPAKLMDDLGTTMAACSELGTEVCNAYEEGASAAFWSEVERIARYHLDSAA